MVELRDSRRSSLARRLLALSMGVAGCGGTVSEGAASVADESEASNGGATAGEPSGCMSAIAAGSAFTFLLQSDGTLLAWGSNSSGQLGVGADEGPLLSPRLVTALGNEVVGVSAGSGHACAIKMDGTVWCSGLNHYGRLGDGTYHDRALPVRVRNLTDAVEVAAGREHTCARRANGTLWCWGRGEEVGDGGVADKLEPIEVTALGASVIQVSAGNSHTCAVKADGTLWCWGMHNTNGQIGDGTTQVRRAPTQVTALGQSVASASVGSGSTCAVKTDGTLWCWGQNEDGQVGDGTTESPRTLPVQVTALGNEVAEVSMGITARFVCARKADGSVWCWGRNEAGAIGDGSIDQTCDVTGPCAMSKTQPVQVALSGAAVVELAVGSHVCARTDDDRLWCWGPNSKGALGDGTTEGEPYSVGSSHGVCRPTPVRALIECGGGDSSLPSAVAETGPRRVRSSWGTTGSYP